MDAEFECIFCNVKRIVIGVTLVAGGTKCGLSNARNVATSLKSSFGNRARTPVSGMEPDAKNAQRAP
jgi:hypothetical protein